MLACNAEALLPRESSFTSLAQPIMYDSLLEFVTHPLFSLAIGVAIVLVTILWLRLNAFFGLLLAAIAVSCLAVGDIDDKVERVAVALGETVGKIGITIALAAVVGGALVASGAADRVVNAALAVCGHKRGGSALAASGFVLAVPVFFDTVFYLLFPLARSMFVRTRHSYVKYLLAIGAGGAVTHTMVPPTPGPLVVAEMMNVDVGLVMLVGLVVSLPMTIAGLWYAGWIDRRLVLETPPVIEEELPGDQETMALPRLGWSLLPIVLPVVMIASNPLIAPSWKSTSPETFAAYGEWLLLFADKNVAMLVSAFAAMSVYVFHKWPRRSEVSQMVEEALTSAGMIILITAAGGAFGASLRIAGVGEAIRDSFPGDTATGWGVLWLAFVIAMLLKSSQGSTTVAMQTTAGIMAALYSGLAGSGESLGFHPVYLCSAIGSGAMISSWMNDSGFWLFCRMGGLNANEGMKTWAAMTALMGVVGMAATLTMVALVPGV